jgi:hypothetical protein
MKKHFREDQYEVGLDAEKRFSEECLHDAIPATKVQDMYEHWDVEGKLNAVLNSPRLKFDVKAIKNVTKDQVQDECTWIEGTNVVGDDGWIKGKADFIVFERIDTWLVVDRKELLAYINYKLKQNNYQTGKGIYKIYTRDGKGDKITLVPFDDIKTLKEVYEFRKKR